MEDAGSLRNCDSLSGSSAKSLRKVRRLFIGSSALCVSGDDNDEDWNIWSASTAAGRGSSATRRTCTSRRTCLSARQLLRQFHQRRAQARQWACYSGLLALLLGRCYRLRQGRSALWLLARQAW